MNKFTDNKNYDAESPPPLLYDFSNLIEKRRVASHFVGIDE